METGFHYAGQAGLKLLTPGDPLASASQSAGIAGVSLAFAHVWLDAFPGLLFLGAHFKGLISFHFLSVHYELIEMKLIFVYRPCIPWPC